MLRVAALYIYPIKSLGGMELRSSAITRRGLQYDRRWMLVDENNDFLTQRACPQMALLKTAIEEDSILIHHPGDPADVLKLPLEPPPEETATVKIWDDDCEAQYAGDEANAWFSQKLGSACKAVFMPDSSKRKLDARYARSHEDITGFADGYPILVISQASLDDLNGRLSQPVPMDRFRPNIVIEGAKAYAEDSMKEFTINGISFYGVKLCGRCIVTTTNQQTGERGKEPLKTLAAYRTINNKVCFGQNVIPSGNGEIAVDDPVEVTGTL